MRKGMGQGLHMYLFEIRKQQYCIKVVMLYIPIFRVSMHVLNFSVLSISVSSSLPFFFVNQLYLRLYFCYILSKYATDQASSVL